MIYDEFMSTLNSMLGLADECGHAPIVDAVSVQFKCLDSLQSAVDDLLAEAGYDTLFDTREKCLEALRQDIKAKLSATITADDDIKTRQLFARILLYERDKLLTWDEIRAKLCEKIGGFGVVIERYKGALKTSAQEVSRAESNLRDEIALRVKLATENAKLRADAEAKLGTAPVDQEGLAKAIYDTNGAKAWPWELVGPETKADYLAKADAALKYIGATSTANETRARNLLSDEVLRLRTELADAQRQVGVWRDATETQKKMRLDLAVEQDKLVAALDEAQNQLAAERERAEQSIAHYTTCSMQYRADRDAIAAELAAERKKWPELKAELATACAERAKEVVHNRELNAQVERTRALVRARGLTISLFEKIVLGHADPGAVMRDAETGETAHIAPDVRVALHRLIDRAGSSERLREANRELADALVARKPLDRDRIRLALLDFDPKVNTVGFINDLADHLVKRLS